MTKQEKFWLSTFTSSTQSLLEIYMNIITYPEDYDSKVLRNVGNFIPLP